jgi:hypothetical protein
MDLRVPRTLLNEEIAANNMDGADELVHVELGCSVSHALIQENDDWYGNPEKTIRFRAEVACAPVCRRCKRRTLGWPWQPGRNICAPKTWMYCIRDPELVRAEVVKHR